ASDPGRRAPTRVEEGLPDHLRDDTIPPGGRLPRGPARAAPAAVIGLERGGVGSTPRGARRPLGFPAAGGRARRGRELPARAAQAARADLTSTCAIAYSWGPVRRRTS